MSEMKLIMEGWRTFNEQEGDPSPNEPEVQTVGQLRQLFRNMKLKKAGGKAAKGLTKFGLSFLGPVGGAIQAGWDAAEDGGEMLGAIKSLYGADDKFKSNTGLDALNMDDNISKIVADPIEVAFLKHFIGKLQTEDDYTLLSDYDINHEMQEFLATNFSGHAVKK
jgi:hypothetical protein